MHAVSSIGTAVDYVQAGGRLHRSGTMVLAVPPNGSSGFRSQNSITFWVKSCPVAAGCLGPHGAALGGRVRVRGHGGAAAGARRGAGRAARHGASCSAPATPADMAAAAGQAGIAAFLARAARCCAAQGAQPARRGPLRCAPPGSWAAVTACSSTLPSHAMQLQPVPWTAIHKRESNALP